MKLLLTTWIRQDTGGEEIETTAKVINLDGFKAEYCKFTTEIHGFHSIQSEIRINTK